MSIAKLFWNVALWVTRVLTVVVIFFDVNVFARLAILYSEGGIPAVKAYIRPDRIVGTVDATGAGHFVIRGPAHPYMEFTIMILALAVLTLFLLRAWKVLTRRASKITDSP